METGPLHIAPHTVRSLPLSLPVDEYVVLVGVVERESRGFLFLDFTLNDGSGRIKVRFLTPRRWWDVPEFEGRYVAVVGHLVAAQPPQLFTESVQLITDPDRISYHFIEVAHRHLISNQ